jgi:hypothetical protein
VQYSDRPPFSQSGYCNIPTCYRTGSGYVSRLVPSPWVFMNKRPWPTFSPSRSYLTVLPSQLCTPKSTNSSKVNSPNPVQHAVPNSHSPRHNGLLRHYSFGRPLRWRLSGHRLLPSHRKQPGRLHRRSVLLAFSLSINFGSENPLHFSFIDG